MGFELPNGKTARNIQEQVKFLTEKVKELIKRVNDLELHIEIVDELPETGSTDVIYFVPAEDPETGNYYEEYMWIDDAWEQVGSTKIDLTDYVTTNTDQTITGAKTFTKTTTFDYEGTATYPFKITPYANGAKLGTSVTTDMLTMGGYNAFEVKANLTPNGNNAWNLGSSGAKWKDLYLSGTAYIPAIDNESGDISITVGNDKALKPSWDAHYNLGTSSYKWKDLYLSGDLNIGSSGKIWYNNGLFVNDDFCSSTNTISLGKSTNQWGNLYLSGNLSDGTNSASVASIISGRAPLYRHNLTISDGSDSLQFGFTASESSAITALADLASIQDKFFLISGTLSSNGSREVAIIGQPNTGTTTIAYIKAGQNTWSSLSVSTISDTLTTL